MVETLFVKRALYCLFATSTLSVGANLPAYLVSLPPSLPPPPSPPFPVGDSLCACLFLCCLSLSASQSCSLPCTLSAPPSVPFLAHGQTPESNPAFDQVIIKSTIQYRRIAGVAGWAEYDIHSLQQMAGRAGRPGFDTEGKVIILTQEQNVHKYRNMLSQTFTLESRLPGNLTEHLNSGGHASDACC